MLTKHSMICKFFTIFASKKFEYMQQPNGQQSTILPSITWINVSLVNVAFQ